MNQILYFDLPHAIKVHDEIIQKSGGKHGQINVGILDSAISHAMDDAYYPAIEDKLTHIVFSVNKSHAFVDV